MINQWLTNNNQWLTIMFLMSIPEYGRKKQVLNMAHIGNGKWWSASQAIAHMCDDRGEESKFHWFMYGCPMSGILWFLKQHNGHKGCNPKGHHGLDLFSKTMVGPINICHLFNWDPLPSCTSGADGNQPPDSLKIASTKLFKPWKLTISSSQLEFAPPSIGNRCATGGIPMESPVCWALLLSSCECDLSAWGCTA